MQTRLPSAAEKRACPRQTRLRLRGQCRCDLSLDDPRRVNKAHFDANIVPDS